MRLEIIVPDNTKPELMARLTALTELLSKTPEFVNGIFLEDDDDDDEIQAMFTPERMAIIAESQAQVARGEFFTISQAKEELAKHRTEWLSANQS